MVAKKKPKAVKLNRHKITGAKQPSKVKSLLARPSVGNLRPIPDPGGGYGKPNLTPKQRFIWAEGQQESGGNYGVRNSSSGALGRWQVMPANLPSWLARSGLPNMSPTAYLNNHAAQDKLAWTILGGDFDTYGARGAASVWYSGRPNWRATYGDPPVYRYVDDVIALMNSGAAAPVSGGSAGGTESFGALPKPGKDSWAKQVQVASHSIGNAAKSAHNHAEHIKSLL